MIIHLNEIPDNGQDWHFTRQTTELNEILKDLIGDLAYEAHVSIRPLQPGTFDMTGSVRTELPSDCSRCGLDFNLKIDETFHEFLLPAQELPRDGKFTKANHYSDEQHSGPNVVEYEGNQFALGEFIHEVVGLAAPFNPAPEEDAEGNCKLCKISVKNHSFSYDEAAPEVESPFAALKKLKI